MTDPAYAPLPDDRGAGSFARAARNAVFVMVAETAAKLTTFAWTVVAARELTRGEFGSFNFALSLALILASIAEWGFDPVMIQRVARDPSKKERYFANAVGWEGLIASVLFGTAAIAGSIASSGVDRIVLLLVLLATFLDVFSDTIRALGTAVQRQGVTSSALVIQRISTVGIAIPVLLLGGGLEGFAVAFLAGYVVGFVAHLVALARLGVPFHFGLVQTSGMRSFARGTTAIGLSGLVLAALFRLDALIVAGLEGAAALGAYSVAFRLFETSLFVAFAVNSALFPLMAERGDDPEQVRSIMERALGAILFLYLPYTVVCLVEAEGILDLLFGARYAEISASSLRWLAFAPLAYALAFVAGSALTALRRTGGMLVAAVVATVANVGLNFALIPVIGIEGAALTTLASYLVEGVVLLWFLGRAGAGHPGFVTIALPPTGGALVFTGVLVLAPVPTTIALAAGLALYVVGWWAVAHRYTPDQLEFVRELARRVLPDRGRSGRS